MHILKTSGILKFEDTAGSAGQSEKTAKKPDKWPVSGKTIPSLVKN
jgi:hypothetical protein